MKTNKDIHIFALAAHGEGISGSDRIFIEFARNWSKTNKVKIYAWSEGVRMCKRQSLKGKYLGYQKTNLGIFENSTFFINYIARVIVSIKLGLALKLPNPKNTVLYSASEFWMDAIPAFILKLRYPKSTWAASWYQTAPNPITGFDQGSQRKNRYRLKAFYYWFAQLLAKPAVASKADYVLINNQKEKKVFPELSKRNKLQIVYGAVDLEKIGKHKSKYQKISKKYDGVFQGRFHPQKGVVELIEIWSRVVKKIPNASLAMIGDGPLMGKVKQKIKKLNLSKNIKLFGYVFDGPKKYKIFSQSRIVLHPAFFDSGGMASAEAMAFGMPAVGFDLPAYESYYPKGMIKVPKGDFDKFAKEVVKLLENDSARQKLAKEAVKMIEKNWSWKTRSKEVLNKISNQ